jgi:hypothetical protein
MSRLLGLCLCLFALGPVAALADGPQGGATQGSYGVVSGDGTLRYVALGTGDDRTVLERVTTKRGLVIGWTIYPGTWGIPTITALPGGGGGLSPDGKTLVLGSTSYASPTRLLVLNARTMRTKARIALRGIYTFDALSPDASRLYLIQYARAGDLTHYIVRGYDLTQGRLLPGRIADKTQKDWVMQGYPVSRVTSAGGRWVYTLYANPGSGRPPFVHALDTVRGVAHCIGFRFDPDQSQLSNAVLSLRNGGRSLSIRMRGGEPFVAIDTATWRVSHPEAVAAAAAARGGDVAWHRPLVGGAVALVVALGLAAALRRRLRPSSV